MSHLELPDNPLVQDGSCASHGVCLARSRRNDAFFLKALVLSHRIGCIFEKMGVVLHCIKCT
jgi:hypothetical protein